MNALLSLELRSSAALDLSRDGAGLTLTLWGPAMPSEPAAHPGTLAVAVTVAEALMLADVLAAGARLVAETDERQRQLDYGDAS